MRRTFQPILDGASMDVDKAMGGNCTLTGRLAHCKGPLCRHEYLFAVYLTRHIYMFATN